jgi:hypothetical protein
MKQRWQRRGRCAWAGAGAVAFAAAYAACAATPPPNALLTSAPTFNSADHIVSTTVFHWFGANDGQQSGPWRPLAGRATWDGSVDFFKGQIKDMMDANIQVMYCHLMGDPSQEQRQVNLFQAASQLRAQGYNVPRIAPFFDVPLTFIPQFGYTSPVDLATAAGKDTFVNQYKRFFDEYYSVNTDQYADDYLYKIANKPVLDVWHLLPENVSNRTSLTRTDVESRLKTAYGASHPVFNNGTYQVATALNSGIQMPYADERIPQFETNDYIHTFTANNVRTAQLKAGYWDQNLPDRVPGSFVARAGGANYNTAWTTANNSTNQALNLRRINVESWNEYDEGSGIYEADPGPPYIAPNNQSGNTDTWSSTNNPRQYIDATAAGARTFNSIVDRDAKFLWDNFPTKMYAGTTWNVSTVVRNEGDLEWRNSTSYKLGQQEFLPGETLFGPGRYLIDDTADEIPRYGGIFRGRPKQFDINIVAPATTGTYSTHWSMIQENVAWFGQVLTRSIQVLPKLNGDTDIDSDVDLADMAHFAANWRKPSGADWAAGDFDNDHDVDRSDFNLIAANYPGGPTQAQAHLESLVTHWANNATGDWQTGNNWAGTPGGPPSGVDVTATFGTVIATDQLIFTNAPITLGTITFDSPHTYLLAGQRLSMQVSAGSALIEVFGGGTQKINLPLTIASNTELNVAAGSTLLISDPVTINANKSLTSTGAGTVTYQSTVSVGAGGIFAVMGNVQVQSLSLAPDATSDVSGSMLLRAAAVANVVADVRDGRIVSSHFSAARGLGIGPGEEGGVLVKYTYFGDTNLDGTIGMEDFDRFVSGYFGAAPAAWTSGDFDYSGLVDAADFSRLVDGFAGQGYSADLFAAVSDFSRTQGLNVDLSAVPEPMGIFAAAVSVGMALFGRGGPGGRHRAARR